MSSCPAYADPPHSASARSHAASDAAGVAALAQRPTERGGRDEAVGVHRIRREHELVAAAPGDEQVGALTVRRQGLAEPSDVRVQRSHGAAGLVVAPQRLGQPVDADGFAFGGEEGGEHRPLLRASDGQLDAVAPRHERSEHPDVEARARRPRRPRARAGRYRRGRDCSVRVARRHARTLRAPVATRLQRGATEGRSVRPHPLVPELLAVAGLGVVRPGLGERGDHVVDRG